MAQQTKMLMYAQERYDLPDYNTFQTLIEKDLQLLNKGVFTGTSCYIVKGFVVNHILPPSLNISINVVGSVVLDTANNGNMYYGPAGTPLFTDTAVDGATTYFWFETDTLDGTPATRTFWDPAAMDGHGAEFNQIVNTQREMILTLHKSTVGFPVSGATIPLCKTTAAGGNIVTFTDCRKLLWRLGTGGNTPNMDYVYPWSAGRVEPGTAGTVNVFNGGDKQLTCLRDMIEAICSQIKEMKWGTATGVDAVWYAPTPATLSGMDVTMTGGGIWTWDAVLGRLSFTADATILIPGTAYINTIPFGDPEGTGNPYISMSTNGQVAWVQIDRTSNAALTVTVEMSDNYIPGIDKFIVARRISNAIYIGIE